MAKCFQGWLASCDVARTIWDHYLIVRVMFGNFVKTGQAARANPTWHNFQTSQVLSKIVRATSHDYLLFIIIMAKLHTSTAQRMNSF